MRTERIFFLHETFVWLWWHLMLPKHLNTYRIRNWSPQNSIQVGLYCKTPQSSWKKSFFDIRNILDLMSLIAPVLTHTSFFYMQVFLAFQLLDRLHIKYEIEVLKILYNFVYIANSTKAAERKFFLTCGNFWSCFFFEARFFLDPFFFSFSSLKSPSTSLTISLKKQVVYG